MAVLTITTTAPQDAKIVAAFGAHLGLTAPGTNTPRNATAAEVKNAVIEFIRNIVLTHERRIAAQAAADAVQAIDPT